MSSGRPESRTAYTRYDESQWAELTSSSNAAASTGASHTDQNLDKFIFEFLSVHGDHDVAKTFAREAGLEEPARPIWAELQTTVRSSFLEGKAEKAINALNSDEPCSQALKSDEDVHFRLRLQELVEMILEGNLSKVVELSRGQVSSLCLDNDARVADLRLVMGLLAYSNVADAPDANKWWTSQEARVEAANTANSLILRAYNSNQDSKLVSALKFLNWMQAEAGKNADFPWVGPPAGTDDS